jgi:hypothetical protein
MSVSPCKTVPHEVFSHPVARMRLAPGAKHLLDGAWQLLAPVRHEFQLTLTVGRCKL